MTYTRTTGAAILDVKATGSKGEIEGYASTFGGEPDDYNDIIAAGAFSKSLAVHAARNTLPIMLREHDPKAWIGKWLEVTEDSRGLKVRGELRTTTALGAETYEHLKNGDVNGLSIGYRLMDYDPDKSDPSLWTLTEIDLHEISVVSMPANRHGTVDDVKSAKGARVHIDTLIAKVAAGDRLTEREFEELAKGTWHLSNSQAERAARVHLKGQGDPAKADQAAEFLRALSA
ncbi:MAG: HK97 family phage prohead protease [Pseudomonadota bacterium]